MAYLGYCGLLCEDCPIYKATTSNDEGERQRIATAYSSEHCQFTIDDIYCKGCFEDKPLEHKLCGGCVIRLCGKEKGVKSCGHCKEYPCAISEQYLPKGSDHRLRLDYIAAHRKSGEA